MSVDGVQRWFDKYGGWIALVAICVGMATFGYIIGSLSERRHYQQENDRLAQSYADALTAKDKLITSLAGSTVQAVNTANDAANTATDAAAAATSAAYAAKTVSVKVDKAATKMSAPLGRLK